MIKRVINIFLAMFASHIFFSDGTVFFSHNKSVGIMFWLFFQRNELGQALFGLPHIWLVRLLFQQKQCFSFTIIQSEQYFSASFSQNSASRTGPIWSEWKVFVSRSENNTNLTREYRARLYVTSLFFLKKLLHIS